MGRRLGESHEAYMLRDMRNRERADARAAAYEKAQAKYEKAQATMAALKSDLLSDYRQARSDAAEARARMNDIYPDYPDRADWEAEYYADMPDVD